jgi:DNA uptake protein ComE-like DNA-binding protein
VTWTPPNSPYPQQPGPKGPGQQGPFSQGPASLSWRLRHSAWVLAPALSFGCLGAAGFLYVGIRAKRPAWWIPGIAYSVITFACLAIGGEAVKDSVAQNVAYTILFGLWIASVVHALVINVEWLRWRATYQPWYQQPQQYYAGGQHQFAAPQQTTLPPQFQTPPVLPSPVVLPPQQFQPTPVFPAPPQQFVTVDVNTATDQQFATLPGFTPDRIAHVLGIRQTRGGFADINEFVIAVGLAPHEFVAIRDRLTCSPPPVADDRDSSSYGRIVDV